MPTMQTPRPLFYLIPQNTMHSKHHFDSSLLNHDNWVEHIITAWQALKSQQPLVHYITNSVAANYVANILLAAGASPALIDNPYEAADFAKISGGLNINVGTPTTEQMQAMQCAAESAHQHRVPWVLDPVGYGIILKWRSNTVDRLLQFKPNVIRGNASEISALAGNNVLSKGVDSTLQSHDVITQAQALFAHAEVVAISGESDFILAAPEQLLVQVHGGSYLQPKVTATGCALGGLIAAYSAIAPITIATIAAHNHFAIAGKLAFEKTQSVGSFNVAFLDAIYELNEDQIRQHTQLTLSALIQ